MVSNMHLVTWNPRQERVVFLRIQHIAMILVGGRIFERKRHLCRDVPPKFWHAGTQSRLGSDHCPSSSAYSCADDFLTF